MTPGLDLLPEGAEARARELEFFARSRVQGFLKGENRSRLKGASTEFFQHRAYAPGDDLRTLDWRVFARSDRLVTREYEEHTNLDLYLGVDASGSMGYPPAARLTKLRFVCHCAALLTYVLMRQRDRFGLAALGGRNGRFLPAGGGRKHWSAILRELAALEPAGETDLAAGLERLGARARRKSSVAVFSDCYQDPEPLLRALGTLQLQGHDVLLYQVFDPGEADLPFAGFTLFQDLETGKVDPADAPQIREAYRQVFREHVRQLKDGAHRYGIEFHSLAVGEDWDRVFAGLLWERVERA
jgi:uncharacterized protein (DUF58 family)